MHTDGIQCAGATLKVFHTELRHGLPSVLFVNAVGMEWLLFEELARGFRAAGFNFITWELRGSPGPSAHLRDCTLAAHVDDGLTILSTLGVSRVHVGGWCTGASVAVFIAERLGARALSLTSVDGAFLFDGVPGAPLGNAMFAMCRAIVADAELGAAYHELTRPRGNEAAVLGLENATGLVDRVTLPYRKGVDDLVRYAFAINSACDYDPLTTCQKVSCPTILTARRDDRMVSYRNSERANALIPGSQLVLAAAGGHYGLFTDGASALRDMTGFLEFVEGRTTQYSTFLD